MLRMTNENPTLKVGFDLDKTGCSSSASGLVERGGLG